MSFRFAWFWLFFAVPGVLVLAPTTLGQSATDHEWSDADPEGDAHGTGPDAAAPSHVDIASIDVIFREKVIAWNLTVVGMEARDPAGAAPPEYWLEFAFDTSIFHAVIVPRNFANTEALPLAALYRQEGSAWRIVHEARATVVADEGRVGLAFPWAVITTVDDVHPIPGNQLALVEAVAYWDTDPGYLHDDFPEDYNIVSYRDDYVFPAGTSLSIPGAVSSAVQATVPNPVRFSNGEATTFHWPVRISNALPHDVELLVHEVEASPRFTVDVVPVLSIDAESTQVFHVFVTTPFGHEHGTVEYIHIHLGEGQHQLSVRVGIEYPTIPQPAGHHNVLWGHGSEVETRIGAGYRQFWMNPAHDDPRANLVDYPRSNGSCTTSGATQQGSSWWFPLNPHLRIGIDARANEAGVLEATLHAPFVQPSGVLYARLKLVELVDDPAVLSSESFSLTVDEYTMSTPISEVVEPADFAVKGSLPVPPNLDWLAPQSSKNVGLLVMFCEDLEAAGNTPFGALTRAQSLPVLYLADLRVELPLNEYHDVVEIDAGSNGLIMRALESRVEAPPGATILFEPVVSGVDVGTAVDFRMLGPNVEFATLHRSSPFTVQSDHEVIPVSVAIPNSARTGDAFEIVLLAESAATGDSTAMRLVVLINDGATRNDMDRVASLLPEHNTPASFGLLALALALVAARRVAHR
jgi:hypothetical protein